MSVTEAEQRPARPKNARRISRELATQALYAWLLNPREAGDIKRDARLDETFLHADAGLFDNVIDGVTGDTEALHALLAPVLDRGVEALSPVEHAILLIGALELSAHPETPYRVIINEAVDIAKVFGATDGHRFVNGVLDRLAAQVRPGEAVRRQSRPD
jgi:N utilization substance protein B